MIKPNKQERFKILAEKRVRSALRTIRLIGNLSNTSNYSYSDDDVRKIHAALKKSVAEMKHRFDSKGGSQEEEFSL